MGGVVGGITFNDTYGNQIADGSDIHEAYIYTVHRIFTIMLLGFVVLFFVRMPIVVIPSQHFRQTHRQYRLDNRGEAGAKEGGTAAGNGVVGPQEQQTQFTQVVE
ncbi:hypothetical protein PF005_g2677 [Phytophthora fragariae]|uniref:Uncharacterized protein n=1 Tax=Phytophthora fragariae TaxID=53985 RepID=A0A6A3U4T6_9STRA|nr:hypothetical protein PF003_g2651 [Phytophthora fragariae]KAE8939751.1 hypothetical protein PF009_g10411 [Phytophthora fragariae]KAE9013595.1 hypothetical protein PF011_g8410 [Phytophthora fragariae]KAE9116412.1 hypothetical protein PF007_g9661 [Phytophthora fragariae]KAE9116850.1 hypothetical protein PF010_g8802 [Phytophthora fragariae]